MSLNRVKVEEISSSRLSNDPKKRKWNYRVGSVDVEKKIAGKMLPELLANP